MIDVDLDHRPGPRRSLGGGEHVLGDRPSDVRDGDDLVADARARRGHRLRRRDRGGGRARGRPRFTGGDDGHHVRLRDPAAAPGSRDLRQVEVVLLRQPANEGRKYLRTRPPIGDGRHRFGRWSRSRRRSHRCSRRWRG